jgi:hypothetical protein
MSSEVITLDRPGIKMSIACILIVGKCSFVPSAPHGEPQLSVLDSIVRGGHFETAARARNDYSMTTMALPSGIVHAASRRKDSSLRWDRSVHQVHTPKLQCQAHTDMTIRTNLPCTLSPSTRKPTHASVLPPPSKPH